MTKGLPNAVDSVVRERSRGNFGLLAIIASLSAVHTCTAWQSFPLFDDGTIWQLMVDYGADIQSHHRDRPLMGCIWQWMSDTGYFWQLTGALHTTAWLGMGLVTAGLWRVLFPAYPQYALLAACLSLTPSLCEVHPVLFISVLPNQLGPVLVFAVYLLTLHFARKSKLQRLVAHAVGITVIAFMVLVSEYAVASVIACTVLLSMLWIRKDPERPVRIETIMAYFLTGVATYLVYTLSGYGRDSTRPERFTESAQLGWTFLTYLGRLASAIWEAAIGALLDSVGNIQTGSKEFVVSAAAGLFTLGIIVMASRGWQDDDDDHIESWFTTIGLMIAIGLTVAPVVFMGRTFIGTFQTKFWLPILPVACCTNVYLLLVVVKRSARWIVVAICGFLPGYCATAQALHAIEERQLVAAWGAELQESVANDGLTVAVFDIPPRRLIPFNNGWIGSFSNNEFTARLTADWASRQRQHFWAFSDWETASRSITGVRYDRSLDKPYISRHSRGSVREGAIRRILWVNVDRHDNSLVIATQDVVNSIQDR